MLVYFLDSNSRKTYRVCNKKTLVVEESMHVVFDEFNSFSLEKVLVDDDDIGTEKENKELPHEEFSVEKQNDSSSENQEEQ